jgi:hypothetical protein
LRHARARESGEKVTRETVAQFQAMVRGVYMKKTEAFHFLAICSFLFLYGCSNQSMEKPIQASGDYATGTQSSLQACLKLPFDKNSAFLIVNRSINELNISNGYGCIINQAVSYEDPAICNNLNDEFRDGCLSKTAIKTRNSSICGLENSKILMRNCLAVIAIDTKDASICEKIEPYEGSDKLRLNCLSAIANNT